MAKLRHCIAKEKWDEAHVAIERSYMSKEKNAKIVYTM